MLRDRSKYQELFEFLGSPQTPTVPSGNIVFGRNDREVAFAFVNHTLMGFTPWGIFTGGTGKDSGSLKLAEAEFLAREAEVYAETQGIMLPPFFLETQATNGGENARFSLEVAHRARLGFNTLTVVAWRLSLVRLAHTLDHAATRRGQKAWIYRVPAGHPQLEIEKHRLEAIAEMGRLIDWPTRDFLLPEVQETLPANLVDFVQGIRAAA